MANKQVRFISQITVVTIVAAVAGLTARIRDAEFFRFVAFDPPSRHDPQVQLLFAVDPMDRLTVLGVSLNVVHMQEA